MSFAASGGDGARSNSFPVSGTEGVPMSVSSTSTYGVSGLSGVDELWGSKSGSAKSAGSVASGSGSGDTVSISDKAKALFAEKLGRYTASASDADKKAETADSSGVSVEGLTGGAAEESAQGAGGSGGASGIGGGSGGTNTVENIKKQIESLKSQLTSLASHVTGGAMDAGINSKINALQAQIASLEAQLAEAQGGA